MKPEMNDETFEVGYIKFTPWQRLKRLLRNLDAAIWMMRNGR